MKTLKIWTARLDYQAVGDQVVLNTTIGSGEGIGKLFAPTWSMVRASKFGHITWEQYTEKYLHLMRKRYRADRKAFEAVCESGEVVLTCYCSVEKKGRNCHRFLLAEILKKVSVSMGVEVEMAGEVMTYSNDPAKHKEKRKGAKHKRSPKR